MPEAEGKARRRALLHRATLVVALALFGALAAVVGQRGPALFDTPVGEAIRGAGGAWLHSSFDVLSAVTGGVWLAAATAFLAVALWRFHRASAVLLLVGVGGAGIVNQLAKWAWARHRPGASMPEPLRPDQYAFPSGHAMTTIAFALALWLVTRRLRAAWQKPVAAIGGVIVLLVGLSRVYLSKHYPTDVLAGWALGAAWVLLVHLWYGRGGALEQAEGAGEEPV